MQINEPCIITSSLLPGVRVGGAEISIERDGETGDNRDRFRVTVSLPDGGEFSDNDQSSGIGGCELWDAMGTALGFLSACGESVAYGRRTGYHGENADLWPLPVGEWAADHTDELAILAEEIDENSIIE
jgi:hypothetical protein